MADRSLQSGSAVPHLAHRLPPGTVLADLGGSNARFLAIDANGEPVAPMVLPTRDFTSFSDAWRAWQARTPGLPAPTRAAVAVACPVTGDQITFTNLNWQFSVTGIKRAFRLESLTVVNDAAAIAQALPWLRGDDLTVWQTGAVPASPEPCALVAPGTGLGVAGLLPLTDTNPQRWQAITGEGGHVTLGIRNRVEAALVEQIQAQFGHASAERLLSGPGLVNIHAALLALDGEAGSPLTPEQMAERLMTGGDARVDRAFALFAALLGTVTADMALTFGATGGVFLGGGILPALGDAFDRARFLARFADKGRFRDRLAGTPVSLIRHPFPAFVGLAALAAAAEPTSAGTGAAG